MWLLLLTVYTVVLTHSKGYSNSTEVVQVKNLSSYEECVKIFEGYRAKNTSYHVGGDGHVKMDVEVTFSCTQLGNNSAPVGEKK